MVGLMRYMLMKFLCGFELIYAPLLIMSASVLKLYRRVGSHRLPLSTKILRKIGVFPVRNHYYEPLFDDGMVKCSSNPRILPGIDFNIEKQLNLLAKLTYQGEFVQFIDEQSKRVDNSGFKFGNRSFESGDAEFLYNFVRHLKPNKIIEIGCGNSTKIIQEAVHQNKKEDQIDTTHICVEPYEQPWLESFPKINLVRKRVEDLDFEIFEGLTKGDLLFIDSSHIIRRDGDVLNEYLRIIPSLTSGCYVHVHDIFTPYDYPYEWLSKNVLFWNEQYLLEALLSGGKSYDVVASLNLLCRQHYAELKNVCTYLDRNREPGSFYFKVK